MSVRVGRGEEAGERGAPVHAPVKHSLPNASNAGAKSCRTVSQVSSSSYRVVREQAHVDKGGSDDDAAAKVLEGGVDQVADPQSGSPRDDLKISERKFRRGSRADRGGRNEGKGGRRSSRSGQWSVEGAEPRKVGTHGEQRAASARDLQGNRTGQRGFTETCTGGGGEAAHEDDKDGADPQPQVAVVRRARATCRAHFLGL